MNPTTGNIRQFDTPEEARRAGYTVPVGEALRMDTEEAFLFRSRGAFAEKPSGPRFTMRHAAEPSQPDRARPRFKRREKCSR